MRSTEQFTTTGHDAAPAVPAHATARTPRDIRTVRLTGGFLGDWQTLNRTATIGHCIARLESSGVLDNLRRLVGRSTAEYRGPQFADSDLYKTLEAIAWAAATDDIDDLLPWVDETVELLAAVQQPSGYLNSYFQGPQSGRQFTDLMWGHELYCLGHLVQAAIAWQRVVGRDDLLVIAERFVDLVHETFGATGRAGVCGHPEIETALVELSRLTGDPRHRELARRMVDLRGHGLIGEGVFGSPYFQDAEPVAEATEVTGHAVRQLYLLAGVTDIELDDPDAGYADALRRLWTSAHEQKMYITGGLGSRHRGEAFGDAYELPADRAYSETCAAIANLQWNWRMLLLDADARYADEMERALYNAIAVSTSIAGTSFFYSNPLQLRTGHQHEEDAPSSRLDWYACACCPPNLARLLASIGGYLLTEGDGAVQFQLYAAGEYDLGDGVHARVITDFPWEGTIRIELDGPAPTAIDLRVPAWSASAALTVDGAPTDAQPTRGYLRVPAGARAIELRLDVSPVFERAHTWVDGARSAVALRRGPVFYCVETADIPDAAFALEDLVLSPTPTVADGPRDGALGTPTLVLSGVRARTAPTTLYSRLADPRPVDQPVGDLTAVPYYRWANRAPGAMRVWIPVD